MKFRFVTGVVIAAVVVWSGVWFFMQYQTKKTLNTWVDMQQADGWGVPPVERFSVSGYPNRLDAHIDNWRLASPQDKWTWQAPFLKLYTLVYRPSHIIADFAPEQTFSYTDKLSQKHDITLSSAPLQASIVFDKLKAEQPVIKQLDVAGQKLSFTSGKNTFTVDTAQAHLRQSPDIISESNTGRTGIYDLSIRLQDLVLPHSFWQEIDPNKRLGTLKQNFQSTIQLHFDKNFDTTTLEKDNNLPVIQRADVQDFSLKIGSLVIDATGVLEVAPQGWPVGDLDLTIAGWQDALAIAKDSGLLSQNNAAVVTMALQFLAGSNEKEITAPLSFQRGRIFLGPIPVAQAPLILSKEQVEENMRLETHTSSPPVLKKM